MCVDVCPRNIIGLTGIDEVVHVYCRSHEKGAVVRKICTAGCIGCKLCEKDDDTGAVKVTDNLAVIDYEINKAPVKSVKRCPTKAIRVSEPVPGYESQFEEKTLSVALSKNPDEEFSRFVGMPERERAGSLKSSRQPWIFKTFNGLKDLRMPIPKTYLTSR